MSNCWYFAALRRCCFGEFLTRPTQTPHPLTGASMRVHCESLSVQVLLLVTCRETNSRGTERESTLDNNNNFIMNRSSVKY